MKTETEKKRLSAPWTFKLDPEAEDGVSGWILDNDNNCFGYGELKEFQPMFDRINSYEALLWAAKLAEATLLKPNATEAAKNTVLNALGEALADAERGKYL